MYQSGYLESELFSEGFVDSHIWYVRSATEYWANFNAIPTGLGTEASPWNLAQVKSYFNYEAGYFPANGDILNVKGDIIVSSSDDYVFLFNFGDYKTITMRAWNKPTNGLYTISTTNSGLKVFKFASDYLNIKIYDCAILTTDTAGPTSDPLELINKASADSIAIFGDCIIISEENLSIIGSGISLIGSTLSIGDCVLDISADTEISDSAISVNGTASITGAAIWNYCEFGVAATSIPGTKNNCTFENSSLSILPTNMAYDEFRENDFNYFIYNITNAGSGSSFWSANNIDDDIMGDPRLGIGAFRFLANVYYVDGEKQANGTGSSSNNFSFNQFRNYFDSVLGNQCGILPTGYDTFLMKNIFTPLDNFFMYINNDIGGYVIIKVADISRNKAWFIETKESA